jgi:hypothetical protein
LISFKRGVCFSHASVSLTTPTRVPCQWRFALFWIEVSSEIGCVDYIDFDDVNDLPSLLYPAFLKRKSFSHEQELKLVIYEPDRGTYEDSKYVPIVFDKLVE